LNTDDRPVIEFSAPRSASLSEETNLANLEILYRFGAPGAAPVKAGDGALGAALQRRGTANTEILLGQLEAYAGRADAAVAHYLKALALDAANVDARYLARQQAIGAGLDAYTQGNFARAAEDFRQALALAPDHAEAWYRLAAAEDRLGGDEALLHLERAVALRPDNARWHVDLAGSYSRRGNLAQALEQLQLAVAADPEYGEARVLLAMLYRTLGEPEKAEAELAEALRLERRLRP
jgi:tetratricopeptide (TPR) repeat protein